MTPESDLAKAILIAAQEFRRNTDDRFEWYGSAEEMAQGIIAALRDNELTGDGLRRCAGTIVSGLQAGRACSLNAQPGSAYCKRHERKAAIPNREAAPPTYTVVERIDKGSDGNPPRESRSVQRRKAIQRRVHKHRYEKYGDHGPEDYGDELAEWCPGCGRARRDIEAEENAWHEAWPTDKDIELQNAYQRIGELEMELHKRNLWPHSKPEPEK